MAFLSQRLSSPSCPSVVATPLVPNSRFYLSNIRDLDNELDPISKQFDERLNQDGMTPDMVSSPNPVLVLTRLVQVADLVLQAVVEDRFLIMTHPEITEKRITSRYHELKQYLSKQPNTGY